MSRTTEFAFVFVLCCAAISNVAHAQLTNPVGSDTAQNTAMGTNALFTIGAAEPTPIGDWNTGAGFQALYSNSSGEGNTAFGYDALLTNSTGIANTATGTQALQINNGNYNTASGYESMYLNQLGNSNTATGYQALFSNVTSSNNTAFGAQALYSNTGGNGNTAQGVYALFSNQTGIRNIGIGNNALYAVTIGNYNVGLGFAAARFVTSGSSNIAVGADAGNSLTIESNNIDIGSLGLAGDTGAIRIGSIGTHNSAYISGITNTTLSSVNQAAVYIDMSSGQLGLASSSERYKANVTAMGASTEKLGQLRPVTFVYKDDPQGTVRYGLIAEEVAKVYPELVIRNAQGGIESVHYEELAPMLLNEVQQQQKRLSAQEARISAQAQQLQDMQQQLAEVAELKQQLASLKELTQAVRAAQTKLPAPEARADKL